MTNFNPDLFIDDEFGFDETSIVILDEMNQARVINENLRHCFSLRVASRILMLIYLNGRQSEENNFITQMDTITRRLTEVFSVFYDFIKPDDKKVDFHHVVSMMNNSIIDFITREYLALYEKGSMTVPLTTGQITEMLNNIQITQHYHFTGRGDDDLVDISAVGGVSLSETRKIALLNSWIKFDSLCSAYDVSINKKENLVELLTGLLFERVEEMLKDVVTTHYSSTISSALVHTYYSTALGLLNSVIVSLVKTSAIDFSDNNNAIYDVVKREFSESLNKMTEHVKFLAKVHFEEGDDDQ